MVCRINILIKYYYVFVNSETEELGYCNFPSFLWEPFPDGSHRIWLTKTKFIRNTETWEQQQEIIVYETEMVIKHKVHSSCNDQSKEKEQPCFRKDLLYTVTCITIEAGQRYRIQQHGHQ